MSEKITLLDVEREIFIQKVIPTILCGSVVWLLSEILFTFIFADVSSFIDIGAIYILLVIINTALLVVFYFLARKSISISGIIVYYFFAFTAGILSVPILIWSADFVIYVHMFVSLAVSGTALVMISGMALREKFLAPGHIFQSVIIVIFGGILVLMLLFVIFAVSNWIVMLVSSCIFAYITLVILILGSRIVQNYQEEAWIYMVFRILSFLLLTVIIILIIAVIIALIFTGADEIGGLGDGGGLFGGGPSKKKKKEQT